MAVRWDGLTWFSGEEYMALRDAGRWIPVSEPIADSKPYATFVFNHEGEQYVMRQDYERLRAALSWISVAERLPAPGDKVLAFDPAMPIIQTGRADADGRWNCEGLGFLTPTHWMPLPEPPSN
jgi:hypothetical protein